MSDKSEMINDILDHGIDLKNRRIYFGALSEGSDENGSEFTWRSVERIVRAIHIMENEATKKSIELHMSSPGGDPYSLLRLHDVIQASPCQIKFFGSGEISSAATWIMACCDERYLTPNTFVLIHDSGSYGESVAPVKLTDAYIAVEQDKRLQDKLNQIYADNSRMPLEFWEEVVKRDVWLTAEEAIMLGLADKISEPKKRGNLRRARIANLNKEQDRKALNRLLKSIANRTHSNRLSKIELHSPAEEFDKSIVVDNTPTVEEITPAVLVSSAQI